MKTLGVIGGLGPMATAYFLEMLTKMTAADADQEHIKVLIESNPQTPDRTKFILGLSDEDPYPMLLKSGQELKELGAEYIVVPCNTAQYFHDRLETDLDLPIIHLIRETALYLKERGIKKVGIMATDGTIRTNLYQDALSQYGIETVVPSEKAQEGVMHLIYNNIKAGLPPEMPRFNGIADELKENGAEVIVLGCTELSLIKRDKNIGHDFIDAMEVMSLKAIENCEAPIKERYKELIS